MKAVYIEHTGGPEVLLCGEMPKPQPSPGQALVKIAAAALAALAVGCCTYVLLLNPLTYRSSGLYSYVTASLPAAAAAALVYFLGGLAVMRTGRGGYGQGVKK